MSQFRFFSLIDQFEKRGKGVTNQTHATTAKQAVLIFFGEHVEMKQTAIGVWEVVGDESLIVVETKE